MIEFEPTPYPNPNPNLDLWPFNSKTMSLLVYSTVIPIPSVNTWEHSFLSRVSILLLTRDIDIPILSVRLSVCPSVRRWYCMKTAQHIVIVFSPYSSPIIPVLRASNTFTKFGQGHPLRGRYRWGIKIRDYLPISRYISQTIQDIAMVAMEGE